MSNNCWCLTIFLHVIDGVQEYFESKALNSCKLNILIVLKVEFHLIAI